MKTKPWKTSLRISKGCKCGAEGKACATLDDIIDDMLLANGENSGNMKLKLGK
jgi:hypothetical protein